MPAKVSSQIGGASTEDKWNINPPGYGEPCPRASARSGHDQFLIFRDETSMTWRKIVVADPSRERAAAPSHHPTIFKPQSHSPESRFQTGGALFVPDHSIRHAHRMRVESAADRNSELPATHAALVLDRSQKAGGLNQGIHDDRESNSSRDISRKRTRSPA